LTNSELISIGIIGNINNSIPSFNAPIGLVSGLSDNSFISNVYSSGSVTAMANSTGGLIGSTINSTNIMNSYSNVVIVSNGISGGLVGNLMNNSEITNSFTAGPVSGNEFVGGLVGQIDSSKIIDSFTFSKVTKTCLTGTFGAFVGSNPSNSMITNSFR